MKIYQFGAMSLVALFLAACSGVADKDTNAAGAEKQTRKISTVSNKGVDPDKITCKTYKQLGSRIGSKHCLTNREWNIRAQRAREAADSIQRQSKQVGDANAGG